MYYTRRTDSGILKSVSTTIAVTLITAMSTLAGASISGYIAFRISRIQSKTQMAIAQSQQLEQQSMERRQIRRDAYLQFLNQLGVAGQILENTWLSNPPATGEVADFIKPAMDAVSDLRRIANLVILEGPEHVAHMAIELGGRLTLECSTIARIAKVASKEKAICQHDEDAFLEMYRKKVNWRSTSFPQHRRTSDNMSSLAAIPQYGLRI